MVVDDWCGVKDLLNKGYSVYYQWMIRLTKNINYSDDYNYINNNNTCKLISLYFTQKWNKNKSIKFYVSTNN